MLKAAVVIALLSDWKLSKGLRTIRQDLSSIETEKPTTTQTPGTGGFNVGGIWQQQLRGSEKSAERERAESFRPEKAISSDVYAELYQK